MTYSDENLPTDQSEYTFDDLHVLAAADGPSMNGWTDVHRDRRTKTRSVQTSEQSLLFEADRLWIRWPCVQQLLTDGTMTCFCAFHYTLSLHAMNIDVRFRCHSSIQSSASVLILTVVLSNLLLGFFSDLIYIIVINRVLFKMRLDSVGESQQNYILKLNAKTCYCCNDNW